MILKFSVCVFLLSVSAQAVEAADCARYAQDHSAQWKAPVKPFRNKTVAQCMKLGASQVTAPMLPMFVAAAASYRDYSVRHEARYVLGYYDCRVERACEQACALVREHRKAKPKMNPSLEDTEEGYCNPQSNQ